MAASALPLLLLPLLALAPVAQAIPSVLVYSRTAGASASRLLRHTSPSLSTARQLVSLIASSPRAPQEPSLFLAGGAQWPSAC